MATREDTVVNRAKPSLAVTTAVVVALAAYSGILHHLLPRTQAHLASTGVLTFCFVVCLIRRNAAGIALTLLATMSSLWALSGVWPRSWPLVPLVPLVAFAGIVRISSLRERVAPWVERGRMERSLIPFIVATVLVSGIGLYLWFVLTQPDVTRFRAMIPEGSFLVVAIGGLIFSLLNALVEESIFRGVMQGALTDLIGNFWLVIAIQAAVFGHAHFQGFPSGWSGVLLAAAYGVVLGLMKRRSGGLAAPVTAHVLADMTIFVILVQMV